MIFSTLEPFSTERPVYNTAKVGLQLEHEPNVWCSNPALAQASLRRLLSSARRTQRPQVDLFFVLFTYRRWVSSMGNVSNIQWILRILTNRIRWFDSFVCCLFSGEIGCLSSWPVFVSEIREELPVEFFPRSSFWTPTCQRWLLLSLSSSTLLLLLLLLQYYDIAITIFKTSIKINIKRHLLNEWVLFSII